MGQFGGAFGTPGWPLLLALSTFGLVPRGIWTATIHARACLGSPLRGRHAPKSAHRLPPGRSLSGRLTFVRFRTVECPRPVRRSSFHNLPPCPAWATTHCEFPIVESPGGSCMLVSPDKQLQQLLRDLITECTRCKCEIRLRELGYEANSPILCPKCRSLPKTPSRIAA